MSNALSRVAAICIMANLKQCVQRAAYPSGTASAQYPLMVFLHGEPGRYKIVANAAEEAQAGSQGYIRTANPPDPDYPKYMIENPRQRRWDYRGVTLHSKAEEAQFKAAVNVEDWIEDSTRQWGARPIGLETLVEEQKQMLKSMIDQDRIEIVEPPAAADADTESATEWPE